VQQTNPQEAQDELLNLMTIMYIAIQETLNDPDDMSSTYGKLCMFGKPLSRFQYAPADMKQWN
jgi:hypothetical protein